MITSNASVSSIVCTIFSASFTQPATKAARKDTDGQQATQGTGWNEGTRNGGMGDGGVGGWAGRRCSVAAPSCRTSAVEAWTHSHGSQPASRNGGRSKARWIRLRCSVWSSTMRNRKKRNLFLRMASFSSGDIWCSRGPAWPFTQSVLRVCWSTLSRRVCLLTLHEGVRRSVFSAAFIKNWTPVFWPLHGKNVH